MKSSGLFLIASIWLMVIGFSYYQQSADATHQGQNIAFKQAEMIFKLIVMVRAWNAEHGVYSPITETNQPNEYLKTPNRDITTTDGKQLTQINPAYMTRQLAEKMQGENDIRFHITSLNPIRPANKADDWEVKALRAFAQGQSEFKQLADIEGKPFYRYMGPLKVTEPCLSCHNQGEKLGDIRGGISISLPAANVDDYIIRRLENLKRTHSLIAVVGLVALLLSHWAQSKLNRRLTKAQGHLQLAYLDALTLLPNRRYYDAFLRKEWKRATRHHYPISMIMIDIDFFKAYNDNLGHVQGDQCLRQVARTLRLYFRRSGDLIARYGGEEFCVVAACDSVQIMKLAEILLMAVEGMKLPHPDSKVSSYVTISLGVATLIPVEGTLAGDLLLHADQALYKAKQSGRNRVAKYEAQST